jgi:fatty-acyl-CoA synthase
VIVVADEFRPAAGSWPAIGVSSTPAGPSSVTEPPAAEGRPSDPVLIVYTSGTTGQAKGAVLDQQAVLTTALNGVFAHDLHRSDRVLTVLPLFHVGGLCIQTLPALLAGAAVRLHEAFDPGEWLADVERWQPTTSLLVPATMAAILDHPRWPTAHLSSLRGVMTGSSVVPPALIEPFHRRGVPCGQVYGATETGPTALVLRFPDAATRVGSCGRAVPHCEVRLVDGEGADVAAGERGELVVRGANVLRGYWRNPQATAEAFIAEGWFRTGDIGHRDPDGWWYIDDRSKDVVISGGENVYPAELEAVLAGCPAIAEAAVVGQPDERWGEVAVAVVVVRGGAELDDAAVRRLFEGRLARFKHPHRVVFVDALPRNVMGKVQKFRLRELLASSEVSR